jgi:hypothetical protein
MRKYAHDAASHVYWWKDKIVWRNWDWGVRFCPAAAAWIEPSVTISCVVWCQKNEPAEELLLKHMPMWNCKCQKKVCNICLCAPRCCVQHWAHNLWNRLGEHFSVLGNTLFYRNTAGHAIDGMATAGQLWPHETSRSSLHVAYSLSSWLSCTASFMVVGAMGRLKGSGWDWDEPRPMKRLLVTNLS